jgi:hypothetical protein
MWRSSLTVLAVGSATFLSASALIPRETPKPADSRRGRVQVPVPKDVFRKFAFPICDTNVDGVDPELVARTPHGNVHDYSVWLRANVVGFTAVRRELTPHIFLAMTRARRCFDGEPSGKEPAVAELEWHLRSDGNTATATAFKVKNVTGDSQRVRDLATACLSRELNEGTQYTAQVTAANPKFVAYDGIYPFKRKVFFGRGLDMFQGTPKSVDHGSDNLSVKE